MDFYTRISKYYNSVFPLNKAQIPFVLSSLEEAKALLDIGCGTGGLSMALADNFESITAIDTNEQMLEIARNNSSVSIDFVNMSMLEIDEHMSPNSFDGILCFGNTVVHLDNIDEISIFFKKVKSLLSTNGKFLFQLINYDNVLDNNLTGLPTIDNDQIKFERNYTLDTEGKIDFSTILTIKETREEIRNSVKLFPIRKNEIESALKDAGFNTILAYSSFKKAHYNPQSIPLVFECY